MNIISGSYSVLK